MKTKLSILVAVLFSIVGVKSAEYDIQNDYLTHVIKKTTYEYHKPSSSWVLTNRVVDTITWQNDPNYLNSTQQVVRIDAFEHYPYQSNPYYSKSVNISFYCKKVDGNYVYPPFKAIRSTYIHPQGTQTTETFLGRDVIKFWDPNSDTHNNLSIVNSKKVNSISSTRKEEYIVNRFATIRVNLLTSPPFTGTVNVKWYGTEASRTIEDPFMFDYTSDVLVSTFGPFSPGTLPIITLNLTQSSWETCSEIHDIEIIADGTLLN